MTPFYIDLETIPGQTDLTESLIREKIEEEKKKIKPPGNYKKAESIAAYIDAEKSKLDESFDDRFLRTSLDGTYGEICAVSLALMDEEVFAVTRHQSVSEGDFLAMIMETLEKALRIKRHTNHEAFLEAVWIGHNIHGFDLPFLHKRLIVNGIKPTVPIPFNVSPADKRVFDTMTKWAGWGKTIGMKRLCQVLGIEFTDEIDGSMVFENWLSERYDLINNHVAADVEKTRAIYKRMTFA